MEIQRRAFLEWSVVALATVFMLLASGLILYPKITNENILAALRLSSLTTAIPFLLVFIIKPLRAIADNLGRWLQNNRRYLWLILTISHFIHLYQIFLYYQLGESCPLTVWLVTSPLWILMAAFSAIEIAKPELIDRLYRSKKNGLFNLFYGMGIWYIWLVFTLAFGLGSVAKHIPFYNVPAFIVFLAGAILYAIAWWRHKTMPA